MKILKYILIILKIKNNIRIYLNFINDKTDDIRNSLASISSQSSLSLNKKYNNKNILNILNENNLDSSIHLKKYKAII